MNCTLVDYYRVGALQPNARVLILPHKTRAQLQKPHRAPLKRKTTHTHTPSISVYLFVYTSLKYPDRYRRKLTTDYRTRESPAEKSANARKFIASAAPVHKIHNATRIYMHTHIYAELVSAGPRASVDSAR